MLYATSSQGGRVWLLRGGNSHVFRPAYDEADDHRGPNAETDV